MKIFYFLLFFLITSINVYGQLDTKHYIPPFYGREDRADGASEDIYLVISTPQTTVFDVTVTDGAGNPLPFSPVSVSRSTPAIIPLSSGGTKGTGTKFLIDDTALATIVSDEGLILTGNKSFFASIRVSESAQAGFLTSKGTAGFGTEFRTGHIWNTSGETGRKAHVFSIMATEDNTTVTISDFDAVDFENVSEGSGSIAINLNHGQSYVMAAFADNPSADNLNNVNGTRIASDKDIVVNSGSWLAGSPGGTNAGRDIGIDQIAPIEETGFEYILVKGEGTDSENVIVVAHTDGTNIYVNGNSSPYNSSPLSAGEFIRLTAADYSANQNMYITANQPVYVYQGLNGSSSTNERQLGMNYMPPIICLGGTNVDIPDIDQLGNPVIQIIAEAGQAVTITDELGNVTDVSTGAKAVTGNSNYVTYKITGYTGDVTVESPRPIRVSLTIESGNIGGAGFFSGFTTTPVIETPGGYNSSTCIPDNLPVILNAEGFDNYQWFRDGVLLSGETSSTLSVNSPGVYTAAGTIAGCVSSEQSFPLSVSLCPGDVGIAKNIVSTSNVSGSLFDVVFDLIITNYSSSNPAPNLQIIDDITEGLPSGATVTLQTAPVITSGTFISGGISSSYDGSSDLAILTTSASTVDTELAVGASITIRYTVRVDMSGASAPAYTNQAIISTAVTGPNDGITATFDNQDFSDNGTNPDADGDGDPTETGENDITQVCLSNYSIKYTTSTYYTTGTDPTPTIIGLNGGTFSSASGLSLNSSTGQIDLSASIVGTYTVTYSFGGLCPVTTTVTIALNPPAEPTVDTQTTNDTTPVITGAAILETGETLTVEVNAVTYTLGDGNLSISGSTWTLMIPSGNEIAPDGTYEVIATIDDGAGGMTSDTSNNELTIDTSGPATNIIGAPAIVENTSSYNVQIEFDEDVNGFVITDIVVTNGSISNFVALDGNTYTIDITPNGAGNITINVNSGVAQDIAGNDNIAATMVTTVYDYEAVYTVNAAQNVDIYANNDVLATVADANGTGVTAAVLANSTSLPAGVALNATTGEVTVSDASALAAGTYTFDVTTTDSEGGTTTQTVSLTFNGDSEAVYTVNAAQNVDSYSDNDVLATVADANGTGVTAAVLANSTSLPAGVALNATTGAITVSDASALAAGTYTFDVTTTDSEGGTTTQTVSLTFNGDSEAVYTVNAAQNVDSYSDNDVLATVADADGTGIASAVLANSTSLPAGVALNATTGAITVSDASALAAGTYTFDVTTTDSEGGTTTQTVSLTFNGDSEAVYTVNAAQNLDSYSDNDVLATVADAGGTGIASAVLANSTSLPAGVALNATTGAITVSDASALAAGTYTFDVTTTDSEGGTTTQTVSLTFNGDSEAVYTVNAAQNVDSYSDNDVLATVADADGTGIASAVLANSTSLPAGVALNATTGAITVSDASALAAGAYTFDVTTTDSEGGTTTQTVSLTFNGDSEAVYTVNAAQNVDSYSDNDVLATVADADGTGIASAVLANSTSLPAGVALNATTGAITVSDASALAAGAYTFDVTTTDSEGGTTTQTVSLTFNGDSEAVYTVNAAQNVDSYSENDVLATVTDADGTGVTAAVLANSTSLPAGVALNATTGAITVSDASALAAGTYTFDVTTTDSEGGTTTQTVSLTFNGDSEAVYTVNTPQNADSYSDNDVLATVTDADGTGIASAVLANSTSLPAGVALNATTGEVTVSDASALAAGTYTFDVTTTDSEGGTTTQTVSLTFNGDSEAVYTVNAAQNVDSYSDNDVLATVADANGTGVTAAVLANSTSLPAGVTLNATTGEVTVSDASALAAGTYTFDVTTTDSEGGTTTQTVSLTFNGDSEAVYTVNAAQNLDSYSDNDVLATVTDADGTGIASAVLANSTSLPAGVALNATTGAITVSDASALAAGTYTFDVTTTDSEGGTTTQTVSLTFNGDSEAVYTVNAAQNVDSYSDNDVLATVADADGTGIASAVLANSTSLPAGVALNATTGAITVSDASALAAGTYTFDVTTTDSEGGTTTQTVSLTFNGDSEAVYTVNAAQNVDSYSDNDVLATVTDADGTGIASAVLANSTSLPAGVALNATTGAITVSDASALAAGTYTFDVTTTDSEGGTTTQTVSLTFNGDSEAVYTVNAAQNVDSYSDNDVLATVADADGVITNAVVVNGSTLPAGMIMSSTTGEITVADNSLLVPGVYTITITTTDVQDGTTTQTVTIQILDSGITDSDGDGVTDSDEDINGDGDLTNDDSDGDGIPDYLDTDDDGDGVSTADEDVDGDGDPTNDDTDGDGTADYLDTDDDGDGEATSDEDHDNDGDPTNDDTDGDGTADYLDEDDDGDGLASADEDGNGDGDLDNDDCDRNGVPDYLDPKPCDNVLDPEEGFSPGSAQFGTWIINGIENYPDNAVKVYNRWGNLVFETEGYNNNDKAWTGIANGKLLIGTEAPDGTYFYVIDLGDGSKPLSGYVIIKR
ncbi:putative Ig domain-containing protein [Fulvivirga ulvae]|uniref:putative Ig domain-containing protein n=1 Tax=Fulvivirga ulvae TaxID=2904245 RepID=UPI001F1D003E|nr:putative Ig domain-containing protein [Fulvivirga ulvae]UII30120.1 putative Ig domain-containing protein [Fulvivirga ulvae]